MKIRNGFVSNSSSSSFVVAVKGTKKPSREELMELFGVKKGSVAEELLEPYFDLIKGMAKRSQDDIMEDYGWDAPEAKTVEELGEALRKLYGKREIPREVKLWNDGWTIFHTTVSNEDYDEPIGAAIHHMDIDIKSDDVIIYHDGY